MRRSLAAIEHRQKVGRHLCPVLAWYSNVRIARELSRERHVVVLRAIIFVTTVSFFVAIPTVRTGAGIERPRRANHVDVRSFLLWFIRGQAWRAFLQRYSAIVQGVRQAVCRATTSVLVMQTPNCMMRFQWNDATVRSSG